MPAQAAGFICKMSVKGPVLGDWLLLKETSTCQTENEALGSRGSQPQAAGRKVGSSSSERPDHL